MMAANNNWPLKDSNEARKDGWDVIPISLSDEGTDYGIRAVDGGCFENNQAALAHVIEKTKSGDPLAMRALALTCITAA